MIFIKTVIFFIYLKFIEIFTMFFPWLIALVRNLTKDNIALIFISIAAAIYLNVIGYFFIHEHTIYKTEYAVQGYLAYYLILVFIGIAHVLIIGLCLLFWDKTKYFWKNNWRHAKRMAEK